MIQIHEGWFPVKPKEKILYKYQDYLYYGGVSVFLLQKNKTKFVRKAYKISKFDLDLYRESLVKIARYAKAKKFLIYIKNIKILQINDLEYLVCYDMKKVTTLSSLDKELANYYISNLTSRYKDPMLYIQKQNLKLEKFINKFSKYFLDLHDKNIGKDKSGNYIFIDIEGSLLFNELMEKDKEEYNG
jgi:hypothetical protein